MVIFAAVFLGIPIGIILILVYFLIIPPAEPPAYRGIDRSKVVDDTIYDLALRELDEEYPGMMDD